MQRITITGHQIHATTITLTDPQIHYLRRVLRLGDGDRFVALDGAGQGWITMLGESPEQALIVEPWHANNELPLGLHLVIAMPKMGMDDITRQATELGVSSIQLVNSDRTLLKPSAKKIERWYRIAQESTEQCERQRVPLIHPPQPLSQSLVNSPGTIRWICVARQQTDVFHPHLLTSLLSTSSEMPDGTTVSIAVGPEGGWTTEEAKIAIALGYHPVSLGPRILRTTTAPLMALSLITAVFEHQHRFNQSF